MPEVLRYIWRSKHPSEPEPSNMLFTASPPEPASRGGLAKLLRFFRGFKRAKAAEGACATCTDVIDVRIHLLRTRVHGCFKV